MKKIFQKKPDSIRLFSNEIERRKELESAGEIYTLPALKITVQNMKGFVKHILAGKQFNEALGDNERDTFERLLSEINELNEDNPEYKKTIKLSAILSILHDLSIQKHVSFDNSMYIRKRIYKQSYDSHHSQLYDEFEYLKQISMLDNQDVILFPSFQPLSLTDFIEFSHNSFCPLGLLSYYLASADGNKMTPYYFFEHDIAHCSASLNSTVLDKVFRSPTEQFSFNKSVMYGAREIFEDNEKLLAAITLVLFIINHEVTHFEKSGFPDFNNENSMAKFHEAVVLFDKFNTEDEDEDEYIYNYYQNKNHHTKKEYNFASAITWVTLMHSYWVQIDKQVLDFDKINDFF